MTVVFVFQIESKNIGKALQDDKCVAMQEKLDQFNRNDIQELIPRKEKHQVIGTK